MAELLNQPRVSACLASQPNQLNCNNVSQMKTIKGTWTFCEVKSRDATNAEGEYKPYTSNIVCSCRKCRETTVIDLVCPLGTIQCREDGRRR